MLRREGNACHKRMKENEAESQEKANFTMKKSSIFIVMKLATAIFELYF
jgi:hypothetical protein